VTKSVSLGETVMRKSLLSLVLLLVALPAAAEIEDAVSK